jgi:hypothetical protein
VRSLKSTAAQADARKRYLHSLFRGVE